MFALLVEPKVMSICEPDCYAPFWELTTYCTYTHISISPSLFCISSPLICSENLFQSFSCSPFTKIINSSYLLVLFLHLLFMFRLFLC